MNRFCRLPRTSPFRPPPDENLRQSKNTGPLRQPLVLNAESPVNAFVRGCLSFRSWPARTRESGEATRSKPTMHRNTDHLPNNVGLRAGLFRHSRCHTGGLGNSVLLICEFVPHCSADRNCRSKYQTRRPLGVAMQGCCTRQPSAKVCGLPRHAKVARWRGRNAFSSLGSKWKAGPSLGNTHAVDRWCWRR